MSQNLRKESLEDKLSQEQWAVVVVLKIMLIIWIRYGKATSKTEGSEELAI
jgi:hypothetical protein